jgi:hypothetical protein
MYRLVENIALAPNRHSVRVGEFKGDEIFLAKILHFYQHFVPNGTGNGGGKIVPLGTQWW